MVPRAGNGPKPKDRIGLKIRLIMKPIISAFLFFLVSPWAYNEAFIEVRSKSKREWRRNQTK